MDGIRGTIPINPVVHQGSRAGFCSLVWYGIGLDPLCKRTLGSQDVTVTTFGSGKWANDINVKSLERVRRRNRAERCLGRFPGGACTRHRLNMRYNGLSQLLQGQASRIWLELSVAS